MLQIEGHNPRASINSAFLLAIVFLLAIRRLKCEATMELKQNISNKVYVAVHIFLVQRESVAHVLCLRDNRSPGPLQPSI